MARLTHRWLARPAPIVAPALLGRHLVRRFDDGSLARVRIVETEAYEHDDPASHSFRGPTPRNAAMFGPAGHLYVYLVYGIHHALNVVTGPPGHGAAVLLRAGEPLEGHGVMEALRATTDPRALCRGPGRLAQALGIDRGFDGTNLVASSALWLEWGTPTPRDRVGRSRRVGLSRGIDTPWRWLETASPWVSAPSTPIAED